MLYKCFVFAGQGLPASSCTTPAACTNASRLRSFFVTLYNGPSRPFELHDALAMYRLGHRRVNATMHQWFCEWSATYASNRYASPRHWDIEKNVNACIEIFSRCFDAKYHRQYNAKQRRAVGENSAMYTKVKMSQTHRRHIGDHRRCSCTHRRCIFDV